MNEQKPTRKQYVRVCPTCKTIQRIGYNCQVCGRPIKHPSEDRKETNEQ